MKIIIYLSQSWVITALIIIIDLQPSSFKKETTLSCHKDNQITDSKMTHADMHIRYFQKENAVEHILCDTGK